MREGWIGADFGGSRGRGGAQTAFPLPARSAAALIDTGRRPRMPLGPLEKEISVWGELTAESEPSALPRC